MHKDTILMRRCGVDYPGVEASEVTNTVTSFRTRALLP